MPNIYDFAMNMIRNNPKIKNNPLAQQYIGVIESQDEAEGVKIANNILNSYGLTKEQAMNDIANSKFNFPI